MVSPSLSSLNPEDAVALAQALIRIDSTTPGDPRPLDLLHPLLEAMGLTCTRHHFAAPDGSTIANLFAHLDGQDSSPGILWAGHTDVVAAGDLKDWRHAPFSGDIAPDPESNDPCLWGRGAVDMKGGLACQIAALARWLRGNPYPKPSISLVIATDEETHGIYGTLPTLADQAARGRKWRFALNAEPTSMAALGDQWKIGRRGSVNIQATITGQRGHVAYAPVEVNALHRMFRGGLSLLQAPLDNGDPPFEPSSLHCTSITVPNSASNVVPDCAILRLNIRFNRHHTPQSLAHQVEVRIRESLPDAKVTTEILGTPSSVFLCPVQTPDYQQLQQSAKSVWGTTPKEAVNGGTSDSRHIIRHCPVVDVGLRSRTMHQVNERTAVQDLHSLTELFMHFLERSQHTTI